MQNNKIIITSKYKNFKVVYIIMIITSIILLIIGKNNPIGWIIFIILFISLYFSKSLLFKLRHLYAFFVWFVIITILLVSFASTRTFPSISGLILTSNTFIKAKEKGHDALYIKTGDIKSFITRQRKTVENSTKNYKIPDDIKITKISIKNTNCEWVSLKNSPIDKTIIYLHGGAYITGNLDTSRPFAVRISRASGYRVLVVDYALAPEHPFPTGFNQVLDVYHWLVNQGILPSNIIILGDSAGGGLEFATVLALKERKEELPAALVCISPWLDLTTDPKIHGLKPHQGEFDWYNQNARLYAGKESLLNPFISPMYGDYKGFPPLFIVAGDVDILIYDIKKAANKAKLSGVDVSLKIYKGMPHDFTTTGDFIPESKESVNLIAQFIQKHLK